VILTIGPLLGILITCGILLLALACFAVCALAVWFPDERDE